MATSGSRNFILTCDEIVQAALENVGVIGPGETMDGAHTVMGRRSLNIMVADWMNEDIFLWTQQDGIANITAAIDYVTLDSDTIDVTDVFWREDGSDNILTSMTREEYKALADKDSAGSPTHYYLDVQLSAPKMYLWPVYAYASGLVLGTDSNSYICKADHTSASATRPITGASYTTYWEQTSLLTATDSWVTATAYYSGIVHFTKIQRLQDFDTGTDNPDFTVRWYQALIDGLTVQLNKKFGKKMNNHNRFVTDAEYSKLKAKNADSESASLLISPRFK